MTSYLYTARDWMAYLNHPPSSSWIVRVAATFRIFALLLILPCILLTALDVASYLIVRTLGADSAHKLDPGAAPAPSPGPTVDDGTQKPPTIVLAAEGAPNDHDAYFTTPSESNPALAGEGIFSPPQSRSSSPPIARSSGSRKTPVPASLSVTEIVQIDRGDDASVLRKRGGAGTS